MADPKLSSSLSLTTGAISKEMQAQIDALYKVDQATLDVIQERFPAPGGLPSAVKAGGLSASLSSDTSVELDPGWVEELEKKAEELAQQVEKELGELGQGAKDWYNEGFNEHITPKLEEWFQDITGVPIKLEFKWEKQTMANEKNWDLVDVPAVVSKIFRQVLERDWDPVGLIHWGSRLDRGEMTVRSIVKELALSEEHMEQFIRHSTGEEGVKICYRHLLAREADPGGLAGWVKVDETEGIDDVIRGLVGSQEYTEQFGDDTPPG